MNGNARCDSDEHETEGPMFRNGDRAVQKRDPDHAYGYDLHMERDGLMYHEIADVRTQFRMAHQPLVKRLRPLQEKGGRKEEERSCGKHRKKDSQYSQPQGQQSQYSQYIFHSYFVNSGMLRYEEFQGWANSETNTGRPHPEDSPC